jgi:hypothetical protein
MNPVGDRLQLLLETQLLRQAVVADRLALKYGAHEAPNTLVIALLAAAPAGTASKPLNSSENRTRAA